ncbi:hypothetical protein GOP47_0020755 [Adiantum capillus-veneris]|uniref:Protein kinase domain-containing protein n=1 Tax=Adiantum capillus-veneris TaxID=13818 RepID=A0A9D4UA01_ADICA|nr:hypothetical protein GOP47_0020755 [Adiantum capillus-veneris]
MGLQLAGQHSINMQSSSLRFLLLYVALFPACTVLCDLKADGEALLGFLQGLAGAAKAINWTNSTSPCSWEGVGCNLAQDRVETLKLPGSGLYGSIRPGTLGSLSHLQTISLRSNHLSGRIPDDLANCTQLRKLFLQNNLLTGPIPKFNSTLTPALNVIDLSFNELSGEIPSSLPTLSLRILLLQNNSLSGPIPQDLSGLVELNLTNNNLSGSIPTGLRNLPSSSFSGNAGLCGPPLKLSCQPALSPLSAPSAPPLQNPQQSQPNKRKLTTLDIILIVVADAVVVLLIGACCLLWFSRKQLIAAFASSSAGQADAKGEAKSADRLYAKTLDDSKDDFSSAQEPQHNKLVFFQGKQLSFDLEDLLRASAEVLGKGNFGTSYKAVLEDGPTVVVKRLKEVSVGRKEFEQQLDFVGKLRHRHLVPLRAYYFSKEEKLLVHEYLPMGSLSAALHDGPQKRILDWETRLRISMGAGKGLAHLHATSNKSVHGNIKSSNILLHDNYDACLSDYGITPLFTSNMVVGRIGGYRAPEVIETRKISQMSDVFSFGVVLLELLTGKAPWLMVAKLGMDLPRWVQSVVREEWTSEVFDQELLCYKNIEEEMVQMLQISLTCVSSSPTQRPHIHDVLKMIASVRPSLLQTESESSPSSVDNEGGAHLQGLRPHTSSPSPNGNSPHDVS